MCYNESVFKCFATRNIYILTYTSFFILCVCKTKVLLFFLILLCASAAFLSRSFFPHFFCRLSVFLSLSFIRWIYSYLTRALHSITACSIFITMLQTAFSLVLHFVSLALFTLVFSVTLVFRAVSIRFTSNIIYINIRFVWFWFVNCILSILSILHL